MTPLVTKITEKFDIEIFYIFKYRMQTSAHVNNVHETKFLSYKSMMQMKASNTKANGDVEPTQKKHLRKGSFIKKLD
jgi:hypothetical protein